MGKAWAKALHALGIPGRKVDDPYFRAAIIETQNQGELMCCCNAGVYINQNIELIRCSNAGVGVQLPTGKEIDGKYLDATITEIEKEIEKWKEEWPQHGLTIMCDSWTGVSRNSVVNFLIYSNGMMYFWKSVDATGVVQDHAFLLTVCSQLTRRCVYSHNVCPQVDVKEIGVRLPSSIQSYAIGWVTRSSTNWCLSTTTFGFVSSVLKPHLSQVTSILLPV